MPLQPDDPELVEVSPFMRAMYGLDQFLVGCHRSERRLKLTPGCDRAVELMSMALGLDCHFDLKVTGKQMNSVSI